MIRILPVMCVLMASAVFALAPPPPQVTANCVAPAYASDFLVCQDEELLELDHSLAGLVELRNQPLAEGVENDEDWFKHSRLCAFKEQQRACLLAAYCERIHLLEPGVAANFDLCAGVKMTNQSDQEPARNKPDYVIRLEAVYGPPSQAGFGSAVFHNSDNHAASLEQIALDTYKYFVGDLWQRYGEDAWMGPWKAVYTRKTGVRLDIVAELRSIEDRDTARSIPMILDYIEQPDEARAALSGAFDDDKVTELGVFNLGDGEAMSGFLVCGRRAATGEVTLLLFLLD